MIFLKNFLYHFPDKRFMIEFLSLAPYKSGKNRSMRHPCQSRCLKRHLPEADETRITGWALRPTWSTSDVLNLCSVISSSPIIWSGEKKILLTARLSWIITHKDRHSNSNHGEPSQENDPKIYFLSTDTLWRNPQISALNNVLLSSPFVLPAPVSLPCTLPASLTRLSRRQWETFLPRSSSLSHCFVQPALLTGSPVEEREWRGARGVRAPKLRNPLVEGGRAGGEAGLEMDCAEMRRRLCFSSPALTWAQKMQRSCFHSRDPSIVVWVGIVWSSLSWRGGGVCYKRVIRITGQYSGTQSAGNLK